jgi:maltooligosyltrehalose trehalohydrolase
LFSCDAGDLPDPCSLSQPDGVHGPSRALDLKDFSWTDEHWKNHPLEAYILYELHTGTFTGSGTFTAIEEKLDHLVELGITAIELMPVAQFPGNRNWGYDGVFPFAVHEGYGGAERLMHLVDTCHARGLAVVLDVVYNHLGPEGNYLDKYGPYFTDKYKTPWGKAVNFDDAGCDGVRRFFIENALMWLRDFHIDALRFDAVHAIKDFSPLHILREIKDKVDLLRQETGREHYLIVECDLNDTRFINPKEKCGYGMSAQWNDEFHHALRVTAGEEKKGYYADFNGLEHLAKAFRDSYVYDGQYSERRKRIFGVRTQNSGRQFVVFSQNHDQVGNRMLGERTSTLVSFEMRKLLAGVVMVSPYLPLLFMGEEWSETNPFLYFVSHTDPELAEEVRKGRKDEFRSFENGEKVPDPLAEETFRRSVLQWDTVRNAPHFQMLDFYKTLIALRKKEPALRGPFRSQLQVCCDTAKQILLVQRSHPARDILCLMNFSKEIRYIDVSAEEAWQCILDSASSEWNGPVDPCSGDKEDRITLYPESIRIYSSHHV